MSSFSRVQTSSFQIVSSQEILQMLDTQFHIRRSAQEIAMVARGPSKARRAFLSETLLSCETLALAAETRSILSPFTSVVERAVINVFFNSACLSSSSPASYGGALSFAATKLAASSPSNVSISVEGCVFDSNMVGTFVGLKGLQTLGGGALSVVFSPSLQGYYGYFISASSFRNNSIKGQVLRGSSLTGGAVFVMSTSSNSRNTWFNQMKVKGTLFSSNEVLCEQCSESLASGGGFYITVDAASAILDFSDTIFLNNSAHSDSTSSSEAVGGALSVVPRVGTLAALIQRCNFTRNMASGQLKARGGSVRIENDMNYPIKLEVIDSEFADNALLCPSDTGEWFCTGGALSAGSTGDNITILLSRFVNNTVDSTGCQQAGGGAVSSLGVLRVANSSFYKNKVTGEVSYGGAISSWNVDLADVVFEENYAEGYFIAEGGSMSSQHSPVFMRNITSRGSSTRMIKRPPESYYYCGLAWGGNRPMTGYAAVGGTFALVDITELRMDIVNIWGSHAVRGGAISMRSEISQHSRN
jgi:hypothetical protein